MKSSPDFKIKAQHPFTFHHGKLKQTKQPITDCGAFQVVPNINKNYLNNILKTKDCDEYQSF